MKATKSEMITSARTEWSFTDHTVNPKIFVTISGDEMFLFDYSPAENGFRTDRFVGLTVAQAHDLKNRLWVRCWQKRVNE